MCIGVLLVGAMRLRRKGFPCPIVQLVPAHKRGFRDMIPAEYEVYTLGLTSIVTLQLNIKYFKRVLTTERFALQ